VVDLTCNGDSSGSISITITGGSTPLTYLWSDSTITEDVSGLDAGSYSVTVTDSAGCMAILDTVITEPTALVITTSSTDITCFGADDGDATATVTGGASPYTYLWNDLLAQTTMSALGLAAGTFTVTVTDTAGCTTVDSVTITEPAAIVVTASATDNCLGETTATATANASGGSGTFTYSWDTSPVQTNATATGLASGSYIATVVDGSGCIETASATVNSIALPTISAGADETIALGSSVQLSATGGLFYNWTPSSGLSCTSCQDPVAEPITTTEYIVSGTDTNNCGSSDTVTVFVDDKISLYLPDVFSPNGDGDNDHVFVQGKGIKVVEKFIIYDRWGLKVFENIDFPVLADEEANTLQGWDGTYKGALLNPGVFVYYVKVIFMDDSSQEENGDFTLVH
jgi:gliding motility-associated-like protein